MKKNITITILLILLLITGGYLLYDKVLMEEEKPAINNEETNNNNENQEQKVNKDDEGNKSNENYNEKENNKTNENDSALLDKNKIDKYKNNDGTYGTQKSLVEANYNIHLNLIGDVNFCYQSDCHKISNLSNVVDMLKWTVSGGGEENQKVLFLLDNGDLYTYNYKDFSNKKYVANKIKNISDVDRIIEFSYSDTEKGGNWGAIAITKNNEYIEIYRESI